MKKIKNKVLSTRDLEKRIAKKKAFCEVSFPILEQLYEFTNTSGLLTVICDEDGYVLKMAGKNFFDYIPTEFRLEVGSNRSEDAVGTNGIGTALVNKKPLQVRGLEHYYPTYYDYTCSGAPIFYPDGKVAGILCLAGPSESSASHTLGLAIAIASIISSDMQIMKQQWAVEKAYHEVNLTKERLDIIFKTVSSGILLLDSNATIVHANESAYSLTGIPVFKGEKFEDYFEVKDSSKVSVEREFENAIVVCDYLNKGLELLMTVKKTEENSYVALFDTISSLHKKIHNVTGMDAFFQFSDIKGESEALRQTIAHAKVAANSPANILLLGESGTGKELFAQSIHNESSKSKGPFVAINCGAIPKTLIESELFGYERGSFTGAKKEGYAGKFELANGGTVFLDEVGDMPFDVQSTLLRVLENRAIVRVGGNKTRKIDVKIIAATNKDLLAGIDNKTFRADLFYRLNVFSLTIPALRHRPGDIRVLVEYFFKKYVKRVTHNPQYFTEKALDILEHYYWPGNVRELENIVERAIYLAHGSIDENYLPEHLLENYYNNASQENNSENMLPKKLLPNQNSSIIQNGYNRKSHKAKYTDKINTAVADYKIKKTLALDEIAEEESFGFVAREFFLLPELEQIQKAMMLAEGNVTKAASLLGIGRRTLYRRFEQYNISRDIFE